MTLRRAMQNPKKAGPLDLFGKNPQGTPQYGSGTMGMGGQKGMGFGMRPKLPQIMK